MPFREAYARVQECIVAISAKFSPHQTDFPEIIGTGWVASPDGVVCTCRHVMEAVENLWKPKGYDVIAADVLIFREVDYKGEKRWAWSAVPILATGDTTIETPEEEYTGPLPIDVSYVLLPFTDMPYLKVADASVQEGETAAFAGFPMGTRLLRAPGWMHQLCPTLHAGLVAAILPHKSATTPTGFLLHANTQGGASGSPVFRPDGTVVGMVYMTIQDEYRFGGGEGDQGVTSYLVPTELTGCISRETIAQVLPKVEAGAKKFEGRQKFSDAFKEATSSIYMPGKGVLTPYPT